MALRHSLKTRSSKVEPLLFMQMINKYFSSRSGEGGSDLRLTAFTNDIGNVSLSSLNATGQPQVVFVLQLHANSSAFPQPPRSAKRPTLQPALEIAGGHSWCSFASLILQFTIKRVDSLVRFEVPDAGCGFPAQFLPRISELFVTHGKSNGTGLGLAISKAVVEAHRGFISVKSSDRGTTFQVDLLLEP
jgi:signal transduction histidine kinase